MNDGDQTCLRTATAKVDRDAYLHLDDIDLQHVLAMEHRYVSGYAQNFRDPDTEETLPPKFPKRPHFSAVSHDRTVLVLGEDHAADFCQFDLMCVKVGKCKPQHHARRPRRPRSRPRAGKLVIKGIAEDARTLKVATLSADNQLDLNCGNQTRALNSIFSAFCMSALSTCSVQRAMMSQ